MAEYWKNEEAEGIAKEMIPEHHGPISNAQISYLFTDKTTKKKGRIELAKTKKASDLMAFFASGADFVIIFAHEPWEELSDEQKTALVDHELCHCTVKIDKEGNEGFTTRAHDVEEFSEILERHGAWLADIEKFVRIGGKQMNLFAGGEGKAKRKTNGAERRTDA